MAASSSPSASSTTCLAPQPTPAIPPLIPRRWDPLRGDEAAEAEAPATSSSFSVLQVCVSCVMCGVEPRQQALRNDPTQSNRPFHQWNIMADAFSSPSNYTRVPASGAATDWPLRRERILGEIQRWEPDIVCLQVRFGVVQIGTGRGRGCVSRAGRGAEAVFGGRVG